MSQGKKKKKDNYIEPRKFTELLLTYQKTQDEYILNILITCFFYPLACGLIRRYRFKFVDPEDALQECVLSCSNNIHKFNPDHKTNNPQSTGKKNRKAFSFFSTCVMNCYKGMYREAISEIRGKKLAIEVESDSFYRNNPNIKQKSYDNGEWCENTND